MILRRKFEMKIGGHKVRLGERTLIMGVLNVTPDSFSDGGRFLNPQRAIEHGLKMARQGTDWIDVGGESTRPGSHPVPAEEELRRVIPVIQALHHEMPALPISIDTTKAEVAEKAVRAGATIINDVSGLRFDPELTGVARRHGTPLILMHIRGRPLTMQRRPFARSIWRSVSTGLAWSIHTALRSGVSRSQMIIDPGLGFGKTRLQNFEILAELERLNMFHLPILVGTSRKSFVQAIVAGEEFAQRAGAPGHSPAHAAPSPAIEGSGQVLKGDATKSVTKSANKSLWALTGMGRESDSQLFLGDSAAVAASILAGAHIVRIHDVESILPAVRIADAILNARSRK
ncbi:MAG TPA: dihydropteroate synthase [Terriglobia bacterium]|nr:dihydropteroate synthase [Terriglobia bacterium]